MQGKGVKSEIFNYNSFSKNKKGQVTIFIIIAVIVVAIGLLIFFIFPKIKSQASSLENPEAYIQACIHDNLKDALDLTSSQGGSIAPENYYLYQGHKIEYLCYINTFYLPCIVQRPFLKQHIELELQTAISEKVQSCFNDLKVSYERAGYDVLLTPGTTEVQIIPDKVVATFNHDLTTTKGSNTAKYVSFNVVLDSKIYDLLGITNSIIDWESTYGDVETTTYMNYYHNLKVEKLNQEDGSTIYILTNRDTEDKFQFASRSVAWPPGYGSVNV